MIKKKKYTFQVKMWIDGGCDFSLGLGKVKLLEHIMKTGSISDAAKAMKMSYRQAWQLVKDMNNYAPTPLVEKKSGGKGGGGTTVTKAGENAIKVYNKFYEKIKIISEKESAKLKF